MTVVVVFGGGGYAGSHILEAAEVRGFDAISYTRSEPATQMANVQYRVGSLLDAAVRAKALAEADAVIVAVSAGGGMEGLIRPAVASLAQEAAAAGVRLGVVGGSSSLESTPGGPLIIDTPEFPREYVGVARELDGVLEDLRASDETLDWFFVCPPEGFGSDNPGEYRGEYRVGGDVLLRDEQGVSDISGADFGVAIVDELEAPAHRRARFTVAY